MRCLKTNGKKITQTSGISIRISGKSRENVALNRGQRQRQILPIRLRMI